MLRTATLVSSQTSIISRAIFHPKSHYVCQNVLNFAEICHIPKNKLSHLKNPPKSCSEKNVFLFFPFSITSTPFSDQKSKDFFCDERFVGNWKWNVVRKKAWMKSKNQREWVLSRRISSAIKSEEKNFWWFIKYKHWVSNEVVVQVPLQWFLCVFI